MRRFLTVAITVAALVSAVALTSVVGAEARTTRTIHLIANLTNQTFVSVGTLTGCTTIETGCQGDYLVFNDPLVDPTTDKRVGTLMAECFLVDATTGTFHCPGPTITLIGRGQIDSDLKYDGSPAMNATTGPITGGTGEFFGALGTVRVKTLDGTQPQVDLVITIYGS